MFLEVLFSKEPRLIKACKSHYSKKLYSLVIAANFTNLTI